MNATLTSAQISALSKMPSDRWITAGELGVSVATMNALSWKGYVNLYFNQQHIGSLWKRWDCYWKKKDSAVLRAI